MIVSAKYVKSRREQKMRQNVGNVSPMSNEGRNAYVIEHLTDAMLNLLAEKPINDISILKFLVQEKKTKIVRLSE